MGADGTALLERESELDRLEAALDGLAEGEGQLVVVEGPPGIGKTRLLAAAREAGRRRRLRTLGAIGSEFEREFPFGIVRQLFEALLASAGPDERSSWLDGAAAGAGSVLSPPADEAPAGGVEATFGRLHALYWLVSNLAREQPLLLLADDVHWADDVSLEFLGFLTRRIADLTVLLVLGTRPPPTDATLLTRITGDASAVQLRPRPLSEPAVARCLSELGLGEPDAAFASACHDVTRGNPFLLHELAHEVQGEDIPLTGTSAERVRELGPRGVASAALLRLSALPPAAGELAFAVALLGDGASPAIAARLAEIGDAQARDATAELVRADLLSDQTELAFAHPIIRAAIYEEIAGPLRVERHGKAARLLHETGGDAMRVAAQLVLSDPIAEPWADAALCDSAARALALGSAPMAVSCLRKALASAGEERHRAELLAQLGWAEAVAGLPQAPESYMAAMAAAPGPRERCEVALSLARVLVFAGQGGLAVDVLEQAERDVEGDTRLAAVLEAELLGAAFASGTARRAMFERTDALREPPEGELDFRDRLVLLALALGTLGQNGRVDEVLRLLRRADFEHEPGLDHLALGIAPGLTCATLIYCDQFDDAARMCAIAVERARTTGSAPSLAASWGLAAFNSYRRGALEEARVECESVLRLLEDVHGAAVAMPLADATLNYCVLEQPRSAQEIERRLQEGCPERYRDLTSWLQVVHSHGCLQIAHGDVAAGVQELLSVEPLEIDLQLRNPAFSSWRSDAALGLRQRGEDAQARGLVQDELERARASGAPRALGIALRAAAIVDDDEALMRESVAVLEQAGARLEHARSLVELGSQLRRRGPAESARPPLREGLELATGCGASVLAQRAQDELHASGARPRRAALSGPESLTASERRVAALAARMTNREIAQTLFVSEKTVETHLGHVYAKLGITSRRQLPADLAA
jgi:DNA-binding CsgD family transcriptional regulator